MKELLAEMAAMQVKINLKGHQQHGRGIRGSMTIWCWRWRWRAGGEEMLPGEVPEGGVSGQVLWPPGISPTAFVM